MAKALVSKTVKWRPSFVDVASRTAEKEAFFGINASLAARIADQESGWDPDGWEDAIAGADHSFGASLKGVILRVSKLPDPLFQSMLKNDLHYGLLASAHIAYRAGRLAPTLPTLAWASLPIAYNLQNDGDLQLLRYLLAAGADPNVLHIDGEERATAFFHMAIRHQAPAGHPLGMRMLLDAGADPAIVCSHQITPLHLLCSNDEMGPEIAEMIRELRARGLSMESRDARGRTPLALLQEEAAPGVKETADSAALRHKLLTEFQEGDLDSLLPQGSPSRAADINGRKARPKGSF